MTLLLTRTDLADLVPLDQCIDAVESAFAVHGRGGSIGPTRVHLDLPGGGFHVVLGGTTTDQGSGWFSSKINASIETDGAVRFRGLIVLSDAATGEPIAVLDSQRVTVVRTAAVTAVALRHLAPRLDEVRLLIVGSGRQAGMQAEAVGAALGTPSRTRIWSRTPARSEQLALEIGASSTTDLAGAARESNVIVTVTPSRRPLLTAADVAPGTTIIALGSDAPHKQELSPDLVATSRLVTDVTSQCAVGGELHHALTSGAVSVDHVAAELGAIVCGSARGRLTDDDVVVFDSTGTAMQDVAAAGLAVATARAWGRGLEIDLTA